MTSGRKFFGYRIHSRFKTFLSHATYLVSPIPHGQGYNRDNVSRDKAQGE